MSSKVERKLVTIMFTDIAGYTSQMSKDEDKAFSLIKKKREFLLPLLNFFKGKLIKEIGDGTLTRYFKADNAIGCATHFQSKTDTDLNVRIGIHTGRVIIDKEDVFGDVVNVASRLESIAIPGSILVSKETIDKLEMLDEIELVSLGMQSLKGVGRLIKVYAIKDENLVVPILDDYKENKIEVHSDDEVPSIAIIPFNNKGTDKDVFYAYGISVDLISDVSSAGLIRVASKKQIDEAGKLPQEELAKKLDVRYMANGELWRMEDVFQLSVELYDTKDKKVVWSDRWEEKWDNLPSIKMNLSDGLLKALNTTSKVEKTVETTNAEAYEFYLKAKYAYENRKNINDTKNARKLLRKAINLDNQLLVAKNLLGFSYYETGEYETGMTIFSDLLKQSNKFNNKMVKGNVLANIGIIYHEKGNLEKALNYYEKSMDIREEIGDQCGINEILNRFGVACWNKGEYDKALHYYKNSIKMNEKLNYKYGLGISLMNAGIIYKEKSNYGKALEYYTKSLKIRKELNSKIGLGYVLVNMGNIYRNKGESNKALQYCSDALKIRKEINDRRGEGICLISIGVIHFEKENYNKAIKYLKLSIKIQKEVGINRGSDLINTMAYLYLSYKKLGETYDIKRIKEMIKEAMNIEYEIYFRLYELLEDKSYLETAYNQIQDKAKTMDEQLGKKFLSYPIPKAIVEEYNKVFKK